MCSFANSMLLVHDLIKRDLQTFFYNTSTQYLPSMNTLRDYDCKITLEQNVVGEFRNTCGQYLKSSALISSCWRHVAQ